FDSKNPFKDFPQAPDQKTDVQDPTYFLSPSFHQIQRELQEAADEKTKPKQEYEDIGHLFGSKWILNPEQKGFFIEDLTGKTEPGITETIPELIEEPPDVIEEQTTTTTKKKEPEEKARQKQQKQQK